MKRTIALLLACTCLFTFLLTGCDKSDYKKAAALYEKGEYEEAMNLFTALGDYEDSADRVLECKSGMADQLLEAGNVTEALNILRALGDKFDAPTHRRAAAYDAVRKYIKENGVPYDALNSKEPAKTVSFPYAIAEKDTAEYYFRYVAVNDKDEIVFGFDYDINKSGTGFNISFLATYWIVLPEDGDKLVTNYEAAESTRYLSRLGISTETGKGAINIKEYANDTDMSMPITKWTRDYHGKETTEKKDLTEIKTDEFLKHMNDVLSSAEDLLAKIGVTFGDLGFEKLDAANSDATTIPAENDAAQGQEAEAVDTQTTSTAN